MHLSEHLSDAACLLAPHPRRLPFSPGSILIAVNPFAGLPHLYGPHMMDQYRGVDLGDLSPHVYAIADAAYRQMRKELKGQSILVRHGLGPALCEASRAHACCGTGFDWASTGGAVRALGSCRNLLATLERARGGRKAAAQLIIC